MLHNTADTTITGSNLNTALLIAEEKTPVTARGEGKLSSTCNNNNNSSSSSSKLLSNTSDYIINDVNYNNNSNIDNVKNAITTSSTINTSAFRESYNINNIITNNNNTVDSDMIQISPRTREFIHNNPNPNNNNNNTISHGKIPMSSLENSVNASHTNNNNNNTTNNISTTTTPPKTTITTTATTNNNIANNPSNSSSNQRRLSTLLWQRGEVIGAGSFGQVYSGIDLQTGKKLAVKEVCLSLTGLNSKKQKLQTRALRQEIKILSRLDHAHIIKYYGTEIIADSTMRIFLEFATEGSIKDILTQYGLL
jgi:hypothetical protein